MSKKNSEKIQEKNLICFISLWLVLFLDDFFEFLTI